MKNLFLLSILVLLFSCKKQTVTTTPTKTDTDTTSWEDDYIYGGVLTNNTTYTVDSSIIGTKWVIIKVQTGFSTTTPNDTVFFETPSKYRLSLKGGGGYGATRTYAYNPLPLSTDVELQMQFWTTLGGSIYTGRIGKLSFTDGIINNAEFEDNQNNSLKFLVWMKKL
jgi:hypothetical protein